MDRSTSDAALKLILYQPNNDGSFDPGVAACLADLAKRRPVVVLAFAPKAAGTFLRSAVIFATGGQLVRTVHAQGGRDAQFYLPFFVDYYLGGVTPHTLVTHVHMQALAANRNLITTLSLKPIIMLRSVPDMLASFADMLMTDVSSRKEGLNCLIPDDISQWDDEARREFLIDMVAPWYASYYATWRDFVTADSGRTLVVRYHAFTGDPERTLQAILNHAGVPQPPARCAQALRDAWARRGEFRYNKGVSGRGEEYFTPSQRDRIHRLFTRFETLEPWLGDLR